MANTEIKAFYINGWKNGWQPDLPPSQLPVDAITDIMNMNFTLGGGVVQRDGYDKITVDVAGQDVPEHVLFQRVFTTSGAHPNFTQRVLWFDEDNGELWHQTFGELLEQYQLSTGTNLVDSTHSIGPYVAGTHNPRCWSLQAVTYGNIIYISGLRFNGTSATNTVPATQDGTAGTSDQSLPIKFDCQAGTFSRPIVHPLNGATAGFPMARCVITAYDRVFAGNVFKGAEVAGSYRYPSRLYWSDVGLPETWQATSYIEIGGDDGTEITSLMSFGETILIFKQNSVWVLTGTDEATFSLYRLDSQMGCEATYGCTTYAGVAYFFDPQTGVWQYDGARFDNLSTPIQDYLGALINRNAQFKSVLFVNQDRLFLSVCVNEVSALEVDRATRTFIFDLRLKTWTQWDYAWVPYPSEYIIDNTIAGTGATGDRKFYAGAVRHLKGVFKAEQTETDEGTAISAQFTTAWLNPDKLGDLHRIRRLDVMSANKADTINLTVYRNLYDTAWSTGTYVPLSGLVEWHEQDTDHDIGQFTWIKFKFAQAVSGADFQINGLGLNFSTRRTQRGTRAGLIAP